MAGNQRMRWVGIVLVLTASAACPFSPVIPSGRVVCERDDQCPSDYSCQKVIGASLDVSVCCKEPGCADRLSPSTIRQIEEAVRDGGVKDAPQESTTSDGKPEAPADVSLVDAPGERTGDTSADTIVDRAAEGPRDSGGDSAPNGDAGCDGGCAPVCGNAVIEAGERCDPPSACEAQSTACVSDADNLRARSGAITQCTFQCTTTARPCSDVSDGFCPAACAPCAAACAGGQDIDCKLSNGAPCLHGNQCPMGFCSDGVCCSSACSGSCDVCTGGTCALRGAGTTGVPSCSPYVCAAATALCPTACSSDAACAAGHYCATTCLPKKVNGGTCTAANQCQSDLCVDGYCCNAACTAPCDRCNRSGSLGTCTAAAVGTSPSPSCVNSAYACNGATTACPPSTCTSNANCLSGTTCQGGTCQVCQTVGGICSAGAASRCCSGVCFNFACQ